MRWLVLAVALASCGVELDERRLHMGTFDPDLSNATTDFVDGITTVDANFLDALLLRYATERDAAVGLESGANGDTAEIVDQNPTIAPLEVIDEIAVAISTINTDWHLNATHLFVAKAAPFQVEALKIEDFTSETTPRTFTPSWSGGASPSIELVLASERYLIIGGQDTAVGDWITDIFDLDTDTLIGTNTISGELPLSVDQYQTGVLGRAHVFIQTDGGSTPKLYAIKLSDATLDATWATAGVYTMAHGGSYLAIDDRYILAMNSDDIEWIVQSTGVQVNSLTGIGAGTNTLGVAFDDRGDFYFCQNAGSTVIERWRFANNTIVQVATQTLTDAPVSVPVVIGDWIYVAQNVAKPLLAYHRDHLGKYEEGPASPAGTQFGDATIRANGLTIVGVVATANSWNVDGVARLKGIQKNLRVQRIDHGGYGRGPNLTGIVPLP